MPAQSEIQLDQYTSMSGENAAGVNLLRQGDFEGEKKIVRTPAGWTIEKGAGQNQTQALRYQRTNADDYSLATQSVELEIGKRYEFGVWTRVDSSEAKRPTARVAIEFRGDGAFQGGTYIEGSSRPGWHLMKGITTPNAKQKNARMSFYATRGRTGTVFFDDAYIKKVGVVWRPTTLRPQQETSLNNTFAFVVRSILVGGEIDESTLRCHLTVTSESGDLVTTSDYPVEDGIIQGKIEMPGPGHYGVQLRLLDTENLKIVGDVQKVWTVRDPDQTDSAVESVSINHQGVTLVGKKPYFPLGLYMMDVTRKDLDRIAASPFNTILPYRAKFVILDKPGENGTLEDVREMLDAANRRNLKVIYPIQNLYHPYRTVSDPKIDKRRYTEVEKYVTAFRDHPAVLAWYISDELPIEMSDRIYANRTLVRKLDPNRPTWVVYYRLGNLPAMAKTGDVFGVDPYPIRRHGDADMKHVDDAMKITKNILEAPDAASGMALWMVPQAHNTGLYALGPQASMEAVEKTYRAPTYDEILAMSLNMIANGARGLIYYSYFDVFEDRLSEDRQKEGWSNLTSAAAVVQKLTPFALSGELPKKLTPTEKAGELEVTQMTDNQGRHAIIITANGPGMSRAIVDLSFLGDTTLRSLTGATKALGDGKYQFEGQDIASDVLLPNTFED